MNLNSIDDIIHSATMLDQRSGWNVKEIFDWLTAKGHPIALPTLYRQINGLGVTPSPNGLYGFPEVTLIVAWNRLKAPYKNYKQFVTLSGSRIYDSAKAHSQH